MCICMEKSFWTQQKRLQIMNSVLSWIRQAYFQNKEVDKRKLISNMMFEFGCSRTKALEYLNILEATNKISMTQKIVSYIPKEGDKKIEEEFNNQINNITGGQNGKSKRES